MVIFHSYVSLPEGNGELMLIELKAFSGDSMGCYGNTMEYHLLGQARGEQNGSGCLVFQSHMFVGIWGS